MQGLLVAVGLATIATPALSDDYTPISLANGWFVELKAGAPLPPTTDIDVNAPGLGDGTYDEGSGYVGALIVGRQFTETLRGELEFSLTHAEDGDV